MSPPPSPPRDIGGAAARLLDTDTGGSGAGGERAPSGRGRVVADLVERANQRIEALTVDAIAGLTPALLAARRELKADLTRWFKQHDKDDVRFTPAARRLALAQVDGALRAVARLHPLMAQTLGFRSPMLGKFAAEQLQQQVAEWSRAYGAPRRIDLDTAAIVSEGNHMLIPRFESSAARYSANTQKDIRFQLSIGVIKGETFGELAKRLVRANGPEGFHAAMNGGPEARAGAAAAGMSKRHWFWAERVVRTEMVNAYNVQHQLSLEAGVRLDPELQKRWDAAADKRICPVCAGLDDNVVGVDEVFAAAGGVMHPPAHPLCRCVVVAWRKDWGGKVYGG